MNHLDLMSFRSLLDRVVVPARRHFRQIFLPIAVPLAICGVLASVLQIGWMKTLLGDGDGDFGQILPMIGGIFLLVIVILAIYGLGFSAGVVASLDAVAERPVDMKRAWLFAFRPRVLGTLIVVAVLNVLSLTMCLFPALYVTPILALTLPVMVEEDVYGWAAIRRSARLAHHNPTVSWADSAWLQILVLILVGMVINYAVGFTVQMPFIAVQQIMVLRDAAAGQISDSATLMAGALWLQAPAQVLSACATATTWLYWTFGISLLYREIRRRKEGDDLRRAIDDLTGDAAEPATLGIEATARA